MDYIIDKKDINIIETLKENSRLTVREIARKTDIRPSTVHIRIRKLIKEKIIEKFTLKLDNDRIGENFIVFMLINTKEDLPEAFFKNPHIKEVFGITGEYDLVIKLKFRDISEFNDFIIKMRKNRNITKTLTMISTITLKEEI